MREAEGVNDLFDSKYKFNKDVRIAIDRAKRLDVRSLIDTREGGKDEKDIRKEPIEWVMETSKKSKKENASIYIEEER